MAEKPKTKPYDYSRRLYVSNQPYTEQVRRSSDSYRDQTARQKHSEDKKPYWEPDQDYPEMEYFNTPWDPNWPDLPTIPDDPFLPNLPDTPGGPWQDDPNRRDNRFLGCMFWPGFVPNEVGPGETAFAKLVRRDDPVIGFTVHGPATIISKGNALCTAAGQELLRNSGRPGGGSSPECTVILRVNDDISGWAPDSSGQITIVVVAHTESGSSCSTEVKIRRCPALILFEYDYTSSPQTIGRNASASVYVKGGSPPYTWSISGTGFTLLYSETNGVTNVVYTDGTACGPGTITVTDSCDDVIEGAIRCTYGNWQIISPPYCAIPGPHHDGPFGADSTCPSGMYNRTQGKYFQAHCYKYTSYSYNGGADGCGGCNIGQNCPAQCSDTSGGLPCHATYGCSGCISFDEWQYMSGIVMMGGNCFAQALGSCPTNPAKYSQYFCYCMTGLYFSLQQWGC